MERRLSIISRVEQQENGNNQPRITNTETIILMLKCYVGTGILAMPVAIKKGGLVTGTIGSVLMGTVCTYCMHLLVSNSLSLSSAMTTGEYLTYSKVSHHSFYRSSSDFLRRNAFIAQILIDVFLCITQIFVCSVYLVFISKNFEQVTCFLGGRLNNYRIFMVITLIPVLFLARVRKLKYLTPFLFVGMLLHFIGVCIIFYYVSDVQITEVIKERTLYFENWGQFSLYFGNVIYGYEGIAMVLPIESQMKTLDMRGWNGVINKSMVVVIILYTAVGVAGYLKYEDVQGSITLNLPNEPLANLARSMFALAVYFTYALQLYVPVNIIKFYMKEFNPRYRLETIDLIIRICLVMFTFTLGLLIPKLDLFTSLVGSIWPILALVAPAIIDTVTAREKCTRWVLLRNGVIALFGFVGFWTGLYVSINDIVDIYNRGGFPNTTFVCNATSLQ